MSWMFTPPTYERRPENAGPLVSRFRFPYAYSVVKRGASYETVISPSTDVFADPGVDIVYQGGHVYAITEQEAALLIAAGYSPYLEGA